MCGNKSLEEHLANLSALVSPNLGRGRHALISAHWESKQVRSRVRELFRTWSLEHFCRRVATTATFWTGYTTNWDVRTRWPNETYDGGGFRAVHESFDASSLQASDVGLPRVDAPREYLLEFAGRCDRSKHFADRWKLLHAGGWQAERNRIFLISNSAPAVRAASVRTGEEHTQCATPWTRSSRYVHPQSSLSCCAART